MNRRFNTRTGVRRKALSATVAAVLVLGLAGCGSDAGSSASTPSPSESESAQSGQSPSDQTPASSAQVNRDAKVRIAVDTVPSVFDPIQNPGNQGNYSLPLVYDQLVQLDADFQPEAMLATSWEYNADGTELTMTLRDDVVFNGDGSPVDAAAVKASIDRAKTDPKSLVGKQLANVTSVEAVDPTTVTFTFAQPAYSFVADLASDPRISSVVDPAATTDALALAPAGSGPYTLTDSAQAKVVMTRVAEHWDETSGLAQSIELNGIPDQNSRFNAVRGGQMDVTYITTGQFADAEQLVDSGDFQAVYQPQVQKYGLRVNGTANSPLSDAAVRAAVSTAINRTEFCATVFPNMSTPSRQLVSPLSPAYDEALDSEEALAGDPEAAKAMLAEAGASDVSLKFLAFTTSMTLAEVLQQQLSDAGITVGIESQASYPAVVAGWLTGEYDLSGFAFAVGDADAIVRQNIETDAVSGGVPADLAAVVDAAQTAAVGAARDAALAEVNTALTEQPVNIPLCNVGLGLLAGPDVVGLDDVRFLGFAPPFEARRIGLTS